MELHRFGADDLDDVRAFVEVQNAVREVDSPWEHPRTELEVAGQLRHGWDQEPPIPFLATVEGKVVGFAEYHTSEWDNQDLAGLDVAVHPAHRRHGYGSAILEALVERARSEGRTSVIIGAWEDSAATAFAAKHGLEQKLVAVMRRQFPQELDRELLAGLYDEALARASSYDLVRVAGRSADDDLVALAEVTAAINDAPTDDLDIEDEVFTAQRVRDYEEAQTARGYRLYRVLARHRETGELAGHTTVVVDAERPHLAEQHDTAVKRAHRGHRLGLLVKLEMLRWLAEDEPQVEDVDTWNAESNDHMIGVNEAMGYQVMGRGLDFQKAI
jgi:GNAT superfamily N-acetyltransferase